MPQKSLRPFEWKSNCFHSKGRGGYIGQATPYVFRPPKSWKSGLSNEVYDFICILNTFWENCQKSSKFSLKIATGRTFSGHSVLWRPRPVELEKSYIVALLKAMKMVIEIWNESGNNFELCPGRSGIYYRIRVNATPSWIEPHPWLWKTNRTPVKNWFWNNTTPAQIQPHLKYNLIWIINPILAFL